MPGVLDLLVDPPGTPWVSTVCQVLTRVLPELF